MLQLIAILFFFGVLVALTVVLEETIRASRREMIDALFGRRIPRSAPVPISVSVPRSRPRAAA